GGAASPVLPAQQGRRAPHGAAGGSARTERRREGERPVRTVMGIESSCGETGVAGARVHGDGRAEVPSEPVPSSTSEHARFGGVVPEIASRAHLEALVPTVRAALAEAGLERPDAVAATIGPGLSGALLVGSSAAKAYAAAWGAPFYAVNHLVGHVAV